MSDVSQGPGWWLASDGKWYPPHTAPQATLPPDASAHTPYASPAEVPGTQDPYAGTTAQQQAPAETYAGAPQPSGETYGAAPQPAADPYGGQPAAYAPGAYQGQPYPPGYAPAGYPPTGYAYQAAVTPVTAPAEARAGAPGPERGPSSERVGSRWQPWVALAGIALILWGAGQGLLTWAQWHAVQQELTGYNTVTQGHIGMALVAAGIAITGIAVVAVALVMDRR